MFAQEVLQVITYSRRRAVSIKGVFAYSQHRLNFFLGDAQFDFCYTTDFTHESKSDQLQTLLMVLLTSSLFVLTLYALFQA